MDDTGTGKKGEDAAQVEVVMRHLVHDAQRLAAELTEALQVTPAHNADGLPGGAGHVGRVVAENGPTLGRCREDLLQVTDLSRGEYLRVAGQDLLHQGRAGAGHAD